MRRDLNGPDRHRRALLAGVVLMTLLPMARHGRLALLLVPAAAVLLYAIYVINP